MARIRADFQGGIWAQGRDEHGHTNSTPVWLVAGDEVPDTVVISAAHLELEATSSSSLPDGGGAGPGKDPALPPPGLPFQPDEFTVDEVNDRLEGLDAAEVKLVIDAELAGRARHGIVGGPAARRLGH